jgi:glycosyltransferase involved in cell wall biosynthesis
MNRISVVMIAKNEEAVLGRCLESVKDADEIIICDTGSTDSTIEVARRYTDKVFSDYTWEDHFAKARNHAKEKATGDWILFTDADCWLKPDVIERAFRLRIPTASTEPRQVRGGATSGCLPFERKKQK